MRYFRFWFFVVFALPLILVVLHVFSVGDKTARQLVKELWDGILNFPRYLWQFWRDRNLLNAYMPGKYKKTLFGILVMGGISKKNYRINILSVDIPGFCNFCIGVGESHRLAVRVSHHEYLFIMANYILYDEAYFVRHANIAPFSCKPREAQIWMDRLIHDTAFGIR